ncbi:MAG: enoyl-CoA hydratase [Nocardioides sp.]|nr:enoyl-CoA hydratase [Nocardioides sp.]
MTTTTDAHTAGVDSTYRDGVLALTLRNPGKRNALTWSMYEQLDGHLTAAPTMPDLRAVTITGGGTDGFAAGTDIAQFREFHGSADGLDYEHRVGRLLARLQELPVPTIAVVAGAAVGGGLAIAASCDLIVAERGARFGAPIARTLGNCLPAAVIARLRDKMGHAWTTTLLLTSRNIPAEDLAQTGFVSVLVEMGELETTTERVLRGLRASAPLTLRAIKQTLNRLATSPGAVDNDDLLALCYGSADFREGVAAFTEKRTPEWKGK